MSDARILDRGYARYGGERRGEWHAMRSLTTHTLRRVLGLRRPARWKVLPVLSIVFAYVPAVVFVGVVALFGSEVRDFVPEYAEYYGFILSAIVLFVTFVAPEALCPDVRSRMLSLYLASPLTRTTYLLAKFAAVATVIAFVTVGPPLLLLFGLVLQQSGPHGVGGFALVLLRIVASGAVLAIFYTSLSLAIASLTDRRAVAAAATLLALIASGIVSGTLRFALDAPVEVWLLHLTRAPLELVRRIHGVGAEGGPADGLADLATPALAAGLAVWVTIALATTFLRYRTLRVTR